eukprot:jgi/Galph1/4493/GphlegSOOS_G3148.1
MHSLSTRSNALVMTSLSFLAVLQAICIIYGWLNYTVAKPEANLFFEKVVSFLFSYILPMVSNIVHRNKFPNGFGENALLTFKLDADLRPLFNLNVKYVYLYLTADYMTSTRRKNEATLWDLYVHPDQVLFDSVSFYNKLGFREYQDTLRNVTVLFNLHADIIPFVGFVYHRILSTTLPVRMPEEYYS